MRNNPIFTVLLTVLTLSLIACGEKDKQHHHGGDMGEHHQQMGASQTKVVVVDGIQVAFDLMTMEHHHKMMKSMNAKMAEHPGATHAVMATVMDKATMTVIKDAEVAFAIDGPDSQKINQAGEAMSGGGMHHYGVHFKAAKGQYAVSATVKAKGKTIAAKAAFDL